MVAIYQTLQKYWSSQPSPGIQVYDVTPMSFKNTRISRRIDVFIVTGGAFVKKQGFNVRKRLFVA